MQTLNQFSQTSDRGQIALRGEGNNLISAVVDATEAGTVKAGDLLVLVGSKGDLPSVKKATGVSGEVPLGFAVYNLVQNTWKAGELLELALTSVCMKMEASGAIPAKSSVAYNTATDLVEVAPEVENASKPEVGLALTSAGAEHDLIVVYIQTL